MVYLYISFTTDASWFLTLFLLIIDWIVVIVLRVNASIQWQSLQDIMNLDCDPQKYLNILNVFKEEDKKIIFITHKLKQNLQKQKLEQKLV